jgi:site-specific recombinase XerD
MEPFIQYLQTKNHSAATQRAYLRNVNEFLNWYANDPLNCTKKDMVTFLDYLQTKDCSSKTKSLFIISLNHYFNFLASPLGGGMEGANPTALLKIRGTKKKTLYRLYTPEELAQLFDNYYHFYIQGFDDTNIPGNMKQRSGLSKYRNYIMLGFAVHQGLTAKELHRLCLTGIDLIKAVVNVKAAHRTGARTLPLQASQIGALMHYLQNIRPQLLQSGIDNEQTLFIPFYDEGNTQKNTVTLYGCLQNFGQHLKAIDKNFVNLKQIRASVITHWLKLHGLRKTQHLAGHRYISSTESYLANNLAGLTDDILKYNPF